MGGLALDLRLSISYYIFNEDGAMLLMRRTGWARTCISHGNGWNDIAWFLWLACQVHIHLLSREKVLCIPIFSNLNDGTNIGAVQ